MCAPAASADGSVKASVEPEVAVAIAVAPPSRNRLRVSPAASGAESVSAIAGRVSLVAPPSAIGPVIGATSSVTVKAAAVCVGATVSTVKEKTVPAAAPLRSSVVVLPAALTIEAE